MANSVSAQKFLDSQEAVILRETLMNMMDDPNFNTEALYSTAAGEKQLFVDKHIRYLSQHTNLNTDHYLSNLRLMTRIRP